MKRFLISSFLFVAALSPRPTAAQPYDITTFDQTATGPWSDVGRTTLMVPKVPNGSIKLDGTASSQEYGGFQGVTVTPGNADGTVGNSWILDFPGDRVWGGPEDSSFTYWLAHDDDNFYIGVLAKDDVVNNDDPNGSFWNDDAIEIQVDPLNTRFDTASYGTPVGGHCYVNFQGRFSAWDDAAGKTNDFVWAPAVNWKYGETEDVFGSGKAIAGGWQMEVRFKKRLFEDATAGNKLKNGYRMSFNIGMDDDDKKGQGVNGDKSRTQDLEIQYWWANRQRYTGYNAAYLDTLTAEEKAAKVWRADTDNHPFVLDPTGHAQGGNGEIFFGYDDNAKASGNILFITSADPPIDADPALIAWLRAKGYTVTPLVPPATADELRAAAADQNLDLVLISETIGSTSVLDPVGSATGVFSLKDTDIPIISFEPYMYDNADWTGRTEDGVNDFSKGGNTGRNDMDGLPNGVPTAIQDARDSLYIRNTAHPIAGGLSGKVKVYEPAYSLNYGIPSADADIVASVQEDGSFPTIFVYEKGDKIADGSVAPNKRIGLFLGQLAALSGNWPTDFADLTEAGRTLILNTVAYALSSTNTPVGGATISIARAADNAVITYTGTLEAADAVNGPYSAVAGATSPRTVPLSSATARFYRSRK